jgi:FkbM family methyltransferase
MEGTGKTIGQMKFLELIKLRHRARKYRRKEDPGGIAYILSSVHEGDTVFDLGAHKGGYIYYMLRKVGKAGQIIAFEPQLILYEYLKKIKRIFGWDNVTIERIAMSDGKGTLPLYIPDNKKSKRSSPGATLLKHEHRRDLDSIEEVSTDYLDDYCLRKGLAPSFLKVDVEGNELKIFEGSVEIIKKHKPKILVEIEARHVGREKALDTFKFLLSLGYTGYFLYGHEKIPLSDFTFDHYQNTSDMKSYCNNFVFE